MALGLVKCDVKMFEHLAELWCVFVCVCARTCVLYIRVWGGWRKSGRPAWVVAERGYLRRVCVCACVCACVWVWVWVCVAHIHPLLGGLCSPAPGHTGGDWGGVPHGGCRDWQLFEWGGARGCGAYVVGVPTQVLGTLRADLCAGPFD